MDRIILNDPDFGHEIARATDTFYDPKCSANIVRARDGEVLAGAIYTQFTGPSVIMHQVVFVEHGLNRDLLFVAFDYPFNQLGVKRIFGFVKETAEIVLAFNRHLGFKEVARIDGMYEHDINCIVMRLDREDCRFLNIKPRTIQVPSKH
jgi:RimJ/RimL family protein N-acetyltransferase